MCVCEGEFFFMFVICFFGEGCYFLLRGGDADSERERGR